MKTIKYDGCTSTLVHHASDLWSRTTELTMWHPLYGSYLFEFSHLFRFAILLVTFALSHTYVILQCVCSNLWIGFNIILLHTTQIRLFIVFIQRWINIQNKNEINNYINHSRIFCALCTYPHVWIIYKQTPNCKVTKSKSKSK